ncbi:MAG: hypothetical protein Q9166_006770 [cf. Caloplaca sp. 2 TL-2023]
MNPDRERLLKSGPHKKKQKPPQAAPVYAKSISINAIKSNIRNVSRVLDHAQSLPLDIRIEKERALAGYKQDLEKAQREKERQRMIKKYHMVRFFERQKATRTLKKLRSRLPSVQRNTPEHEKLEIEIQIAEVDLNYALYHPLTEKYIGIFPRQETTTAQEETGHGPAQRRQNRPAMWAVVESCMENGTLQALRDGKLRSSYAHAAPLQPIAAKAAPEKVSDEQKTQKRQSKAKAVVSGHEDESDGGFFEE